MIVITPLDETNKALDNALILEATLSENHSFEMEITSHPRENTTNVSDNIYRQPRRLTAQCLISDDPNQIFGGGLITDWIRSNPNEPYSFTVWNYLKKIADSKYPLLVDTTLETYYPMYIKGITNVVRDKTTYKALRFNIEFWEVIQVETALVAAPKKTSPANADKTASQKNQGKKKGEPVNDAETSKANSSLLYDFGDLVGARQ